MAKHILWCETCKKYSMKEICDCGIKNNPKLPPKYSPEDKYGSYRRKVKKEELIKENLL